MRLLWGGGGINRKDPSLAPQKLLFFEKQQFIRPVQSSLQSRLIIFG